MGAKSFYQLLFRASFSQQVAKQAKGEEGLEDIWANGYMVCNHLVRIYDEPDKSTIRAAILRRAGIILPPRYPGADLLTPIKPIEGFKDKKSITCQLVQVKNRVNKTMKSGLSIQTSAARELGLDFKYFGLMMCLRGK